MHEDGPVEVVLGAPLGGIPCEFSHDSESTNGDHGGESRRRLSHGFGAITDDSGVETMCHLPHRVEGKMHKPRHTRHRSTKEESYRKLQVDGDRRRYNFACCLVRLFLGMCGS